MRSEKENVAEEFIINRMREFPTLYPHSYAVISNNILGTCGDLFWNEKGLIEMGDQDWDNESKKWVPYPKEISREVAQSLYLHYQGKFISIHDNLRGPINNIPDNAHPDWLHEIDMFLYHFERYKEEDVINLGRMKCFLHYNMYENKNAGEPERTIENYMAFLKRIPSWRAKIREIEYLQYYGKLDPATFQGMYI